MKKKSCRRNIEEEKNHEVAVKLRKMTDKQLVEYIEEQTRIAHSDGVKAGSMEGKKNDGSVCKIKEFINEVSESGIAGIGKVTIKKLMAFAMEKGYLQEEKNGI